MRARGAHISKMMIIQVESGGEPLQVPRKQQYLEDGADQILVGFLINGGGCEGGRRGGTELGQPYHVERRIGLEILIGFWRQHEN